MKAFIFNSGIGSRMKHLTKNSPKALVKLSNGETILGRQIRILKDYGIKEFIITTGPFEQKIKDYTSNIKGIEITYVKNEIYDKTNSIYSLYLARDLFDEEFVVLHGDLVFNKEIIKKLIDSNKPNIGLIGKTVPLPDKDFKALVVNDKLKQISVDIYGENVYALQPMYKMSKDMIHLWLNKVVEMVTNKTLNVYAEDALNDVLDESSFSILDYSNEYIDEVDNLEDLDRVSKIIGGFDYNDQEIIIDSDYCTIINEYLKRHNLKKPLLVHGKHLLSDSYFLEFKTKLDCPTFCDYSPNPLYEEVINGLNVFNQENCDSIIAIGGGSCIDVAKAIKLYSPYDTNQNIINSEPKYVDLKLIALPTTAGTGTESTRYSVIYYNNEKQSLVNDSLLPDFVILNNEFLKNLPIYQRKSTLLDALCQSIEAFWSVNSTRESKEYSKEAIKIMLKTYKSFIDGNNDSLDLIMKASNLAGKAINITQTTAPHAMSYKITSLTGISHGHAVSLCLPAVYEYMIENIEKSIDYRGIQYVEDTFKELAYIFGASSYVNLKESFKGIFNDFNMEIPKLSKKSFPILVNSVNQKRLKNNPILLSKDAIQKIYMKVFNFHQIGLK